MTTKEKLSIAYPVTEIRSQPLFTKPFTNKIIIDWMKSKITELHKENRAVAYKPTRDRLDAKEAAMAQKRRNAVRYRVAGYTYKDIAKELKVSTAYARGLVLTALRMI